MLLLIPPVHILCAFLFIQPCASSIGTEKANMATLKFVHVIFRHGDRAPLATIPSDTANDESTWSMGLGQATEWGIRQSYNLGKWLRSRYDGLISRTNLKKEIYVRSTGFDRTIQSAMATVAGLYGPAYSDVAENEDIVFHPVSIHSRPAEDDPMLYTLTDCPRAKILFAKQQASEEMQRIEKEHANLLNFLSEKTGLNQKISLDPEIRSIYDTLFIERLHNNPCADDKGHSWPSWMNDTIWQEIVKLNDVANKNKFINEEIQRLRGGLLLSDIIQRMRNKTRERTSLKFYAYSTHDTTMLAFLANLGYLTDQLPSYASAILIELHEQQNQNYVEVFFKHEVNSVDKLEAIEVSDCLRPFCSFIQFAKRSETRIPKDWYSECGFSAAPCKVT